MDFSLGFIQLFLEPGQRGNPAGWIVNSNAFSEKYTALHLPNHATRTLKTSELARISEYNNQRDCVPEHCSYIINALNIFRDIESVPYFSTLRVVGYFSIIESLITHALKLLESLDSITHQLCNKLSLIGKRAERPFEIEQHFGSHKAETIWKKLYAYRSGIAHGTHQDFTSSLSILKNQEAVTKFLKEAVKSLLIYSLRDPEFINDLRHC